MQFNSHPSQTIGNSKVANMMLQVLLAMVPGIVAMFWFFGWGILTNLVLTSLFAIGFEAIALKMRQRPIKPFVSDYSALVTAWLIAVSLPAFAPWWLLLIATFFAIIVAKHLYGGLGYNPFNPAMIAYAVVLISFPIAMVQWPTPIDFHISTIGLSDTLAVVFQNKDINSLANTVLAGSTTQQYDSFTSATILDTLKTGLRDDGFIVANLAEKSNYGLLAGKAWEWISVGWLVGGLWLIYKNIISWHIPVALLAGLTLFSGLFWAVDSHSYASPLFHILAGGTLLAAFFIATDPVSASTTPVGKLIYAASIGGLIYIIRALGSGYPDGVAFAVIIMNMAVPLIDYYTRPKSFGR